MKSFKKIFGIVILIIILFGAYNITNGANEGLLLSTRKSDDLVGNELLALLLEIKSIKLDATIFDRKSFNNLKDFSIEIKSQPTGRVNPFAVIGSEPVQNTSVNEEDLNIESDLDLDLGI